MASRTTHSPQPRFRSLHHTTRSRQHSPATPAGHRKPARAEELPTLGESGAMWTVNSSSKLARLATWKSHLNPKIPSHRLKTDPQNGTAKRRSQAFWCEGTFRPLEGLQKAARDLSTVQRVLQGPYFCAMQRCM
ncbi:hypothetical protein [Streptomyces sp. NPDC002209]|uniref:hypothetical protein n=1 Tax=Streptomyces sp. NPDC002209 TaxID=3364638 RepID=UPI0036C02E22